LFIAVLLNQDIAGKTFFRAILFIPVIIPTASAALAWQWMYATTGGIFNQLLQMVGLAPVPWLSNTHYAIWSVIIEAIWASLGLNVVIFLAGLQNIDAEYYEAAEIDGAGAWLKFRYVTLPLLSPTTFFVLVIGVIGTIQAFDVPYVMTGGGPANSTQMIVMYLYTNAFRLQRMGLASAIGYMVFIIILILTFINFRFEKRWVFYEEAA
jgi:multiple sugar transport system permease protein